MNSENNYEQQHQMESVAQVLKEILNELKEINVSLKSIARSQANQSSMQRAVVEKNRK